MTSGSRPARMSSSLASSLDRSSSSEEAALSPLAGSKTQKLGGREVSYAKELELILVGTEMDA